MRSLLALCLALAASPLSPAQSAPLPLNGDFESMSPATRRPHGWPAAPSVSWPVEDGNRFLRLQSSEPGRMDALRVHVSIPSEVRALELSCRVRLSGFALGEKPWFDARVILNLKDAGGKTIAVPPPTVLNRDTRDWVARSVRFLVPPEAVSLEVMPALYRVRSGVFDLDDLALRPIDAVALEKQLALDAPPPVPPHEEPRPEKFPAELRVAGNRLHDAAGREVWLQGLNVASLEWNPRGENVLRSILVAIEDWRANTLRLPLSEAFWFGRDPRQKDDGGRAYRELVDQIVVLAANRGAYVVLDLHDYRAPRREHLAFWTDVAARFKNHPAIFFDLLNEPHGITWDIWRDGGFVTERKAGANEENFIAGGDAGATRAGFQSPGMQKLLDAVRATGARNLVVAGGLDYAYDLSGILNGYALEDRAGNGVVYASHVYPWKRDWQRALLDVAALHPVLIGEVGANHIPRPWETPATFVDPHGWLPDMLGLIQKHRLHWTGWCFHKSASPAMLLDWTYAPTPYWGAYAKRALAGEAFEFRRLR